MHLVIANLFCVKKLWYKINNLCILNMVKKPSIFKHKFPQFTLKLLPGNVKHPIKQRRILELNRNVNIY